MRTLVFAAIVLAGFNNTAQALEIHSDHWIYGMPEASDQNDLIFRHDYVLSNNPDTKFADWVAYKLTPRLVWGGPDLDRNWRADPYLAEDETLEPKPKTKDDYKKAHDEPLEFDRGHMAPLASFKGSVYAREVNYYSNITPQAAALNRGPWLGVEDQVRKYVCSGRNVWVITGTLYEKAMDPLPKADEPHTVPSGFWKIVATKKDVVGFIMEQTEARNTDPKTLAKSVAEIETRSGLNLMPDLSDKTGNDPGWLFDVTETCLSRF